MCFIFKSKGLLSYITGTAIKPPIINPALSALTQPLNEQIAIIEKFKKKEIRKISKEGLPKAQIIIAVSKSITLILKNYNTAKAMWETLVAEMMKMVLTTLQRQLHNIKCSEEDNIHEHLDKAQNLYACLREMGASISEEEFMDIILSSLPPSYKLIINALMILLEEWNQPIILLGC